MKLLRARLTPTAALPLLLIPLILLIVASQLQRPSGSGAPGVSPPPRADYYLRGAEVSTMDENGRLLYRVNADTVLHFPDESVTLDGVEVDYIDGPWTLDARQGQIPPRQRRLVLSGDVQMQGRLRSGQQVRLNTSEMDIAFDQRLIETNARVDMQSETIRATAVGMQTDLAGRELRLISQVKVRYEP